MYLSFVGFFITTFEAKYSIYLFLFRYNLETRNKLTFSQSIDKLLMNFKLLINIFRFSK